MTNIISNRKSNVVRGCSRLRSDIGFIGLTESLFFKLVDLVNYFNDEWMLVLGCPVSFSLGGRQWLAYTDLVVPKQKRSGVDVEIREQEFDLLRGFNFVVHSHHGMGAFWSSTDRFQLNTKFAGSLVVARNRASGFRNNWRLELLQRFGWDRLLPIDYLCEHSYKLPCGLYGKYVCLLVVVRDDNPKDVLFIDGLGLVDSGNRIRLEKELIEKINDKKLLNQLYPDDEVGTGCLSYREERYGRYIEKKIATCSDNENVYEEISFLTKVLATEDMISLREEIKEKTEAPELSERLKFILGKEEDPEDYYRKLGLLDTEKDKNKKERYGRYEIEKDNDDDYEMTRFWDLIRKNRRKKDK